MPRRIAKAFRSVKWLRRVGRTARRLGKRLFFLTRCPHMLALRFARFRDSREGIAVDICHALANVFGLPPVESPGQAVRFACLIDHAEVPPVALCEDVTALLDGGCEHF